MTVHLGSFILIHSQRSVSNFIPEIDGLKMKNVYYTDTDSLNVEKKHRDVLDKGKPNGEKLCHGENDYRKGGIFFKVISCT